MALIKSISGIRGTIGGVPGTALTPIDIVKFTYAYCVKLRERLPKQEGERYLVVVGKDARISGEMVENLVSGTIISCGIDVLKIGFASTPTTEMAVTMSGADGGIILTASHNPKQWNALKLLNERGEFLNAEQGRDILDCAEAGNFDFAPVECLGKITEKDFTDRHIDEVLSLETVNVEAIKKAKFKVVLDAINSVGGIIMPRLMERLGVECIKINCEPTGDFAHNPEPLPKNLIELCNTVVKEKADLGISVDPDVDRLALICENGEPFVEENTLVAVADYLFSKLAEKAQKSACSLEKAALPYKPVAVSNLSSTRGLRDVVEKWGGNYYASAVGEVNVTDKMKAVGAIIGGEGNGGVIYPESHYGRDAMVGIALMLSSLAEKKISMTKLKSSLPQYYIAKNRMEVSDRNKIDKILTELKKIYRNEDINDIDGVKISFEEKRQWVHLRRSNTEPIIRIYSEAKTADEAEKLGNEIIGVAKNIIEA